MKIFVNREKELAILNRQKALTVIFGRRRIGKTALVKHWGKKHPSHFYYSQAIEASEKIQVQQVVEDLQELLPKDLNITSWKELFSLFSLIRKSVIIALDEFPYWVKTQPSLPSLLQRWIDHQRPENVSLILLGSSQSMMHQLFLESTSPLYERADFVLQMSPLSYQHYCQAVDLDPLLSDTFLRFSLVGGVPKYFDWSKESPSLEALANELFFSSNARLESEPDRLLKDENVQGLQAKSILEAIGRGAHRATEVATRLEISQTALSKPLQILLHTSLIQRELPFGESLRTTKRTLYSISDPALQFWYGCFSPHRSRWHLYSTQEKMKLFHEHASQVLEDAYRTLFLDAARYWESNLEFDCVRYDPKDRDSVIISEIKLASLSEKERQNLQSKIKYQFSQSQLSKKFGLSKIEVLDLNDVLRHLSRR